MRIKKSTHERNCLVGVGKQLPVLISTSNASTSCLALLEHETSLLYEVSALVEKDPAAKKILEDIAADERRHVDTLKLIVEITSTATTS